MQPIHLYRSGGTRCCRPDATKDDRELSGECDLGFFRSLPIGGLTAQTRGPSTIRLICRLPLLKVRAVRTISALALLMRPVRASSTD